MNAVLSPLRPVTSPPLWARASRLLASKEYAVLAGSDVAEAADVCDSSWHDFADHWNRLTLDRHMGDGGRYRLRRYGQFNTQPDGSLLQLPHGPYEQPSYVNALNGGIPRYFDPLEPGFVAHPVLQGILSTLVRIVDAAEGHPSSWNIRLHPYRILARSGEVGQPTPEGLHRDGVHYIVSMMVRRQNVVGGESMITDVRRRLLDSATLTEPMHTFIANDERTMHAVTAISPMIDGVPAYRDVLVVAFTRQEPA